ncbi:MAG TPA: cupredoxin domain-containing protein [Actinomycetota bacterium]|nr:cupredoxin domain-containing protein [Actinomycetota bacterium]
MQRPPWLVVVLLVVALVSTAGWVATAVRRPAPATTAAAQHHDHRSHDHGTHSHGGTAQNTPPTAPRDGVIAMTVPPLPKTAVNFIWKPEHMLVAAGQKVTLKVANADYMQHNFTFKPAKVAKNLPVDETTTIQLTAPTKPGVYIFYCKYHLQMMEGALTVR